VVDELVVEGGVGQGELFEEPEDPLGLGMLGRDELVEEGRDGGMGGRCGGRSGWRDGRKVWRNGMGETRVAYIEMVEGQFGHGVGVGNVYDERMRLRSALS